MGYDTHIVVVQECLEGPEYERDMDKPYDDGSGYEYKKDEKGQDIQTGRTQIYCMSIAELDLCKLGHDHPLHQVHNAASTKAKEQLKERFYYRYGTDGNTMITDDPYGDPLCVGSLDDVVEALELDADSTEIYRRTKWAYALLKSIQESDTNKNFSVMFYGS